MRHEWNEARRRIQVPDRAAHLIRLGIQNDLAAQHIGEWIADFRRTLPDTAFYIEPDYSNQMCADVLTGILDFAVMYSPKPHPDLHFSELGEVTYRMVSTDTDRRAGVKPETFIFAHFSPMFEALHRDLTPEFASAPVSVGQSATVASLLTAMGGAGYVLERTATQMLASGRFREVTDAPVLRQPVFAATHLRHRITLELIAEIGLPHHRLLSSKLGSKASRNLGAIHREKCGLPKSLRRDHGVKMSIHKRLLLKASEDTSCICAQLC